MAWRVAKSLIELRNQINAAHPARDKDADGTIGDARHAATISDHNPDRYGIVRALDVTHDPEGNTLADTLDAHALADTLIASRDPRLKYVISRGRIASSYPVGGVPAWTWRKYTGSDPHTGHIHVSVLPTAPADRATPWQLTPKALAPRFPGTIRLGSHGAPVSTWQRALNRHEKAGLTVDGKAGPRTLTAIRNAQRAHRIAVDGIAGPNTWAAIHR